MVSIAEALKTNQTVKNLDLGCTLYAFLPVENHYF